MIVEKAVNMAAMMKKNVVGLVENMSYYVCPDCGAKHEIFGASRADGLAALHGIPNVAKLPGSIRVSPPAPTAVSWRYSPATGSTAWPTLSRNSDKKAPSPEGAFAASPCRSGKDFGHDAVLLQ